MTEIQLSQIEICKKYNAAFCDSPMDYIVGVSPNVKDNIMPINGVRYEVNGQTSGWYIWGSEEFSEEDDFFVPLHISHLLEWCPAVVKYLGLPPGWRFLMDENGYEDVWND